MDYILSKAEEAILDIYLFVRYFDFTDLGINPQEA
jgi:hypothetical protein